MKISKRDFIALVKMFRLWNKRGGPVRYTEFAYQNFILYDLKNAGLIKRVGTGLYEPTEMALRFFNNEIPLDINGELLYFTDAIKKVQLPPEYSEYFLTCPCCGSRMVICIQNS